jgi:hypothetical protein
LERIEQAPLRYAVVVYLPGEARLDGVVRWDGERAELTAEWDDPWATETALKLARVVKRTAQPRLVRWRERDGGRPSSG